MSQVSKQDFKNLRMVTARAFAAMHGRINDLQLIVEAQGLAIKEAVHLTPEQAARYRARIDATHAKIAGAAALGAMLAGFGASLLADPEAPAEAAAVLAALEHDGPFEQPAALDIYDLVEPDSDARPAPWWARWWRRAA